jgi:hypothetical protein
MQVAVRASGDPAAIMSALRRSVAEMDPMLPVGELRKMDDAVRQAGAPQSFSTYLLSAFAALALLLATLGIAGVVAYSAGQRTREIGLACRAGSLARQDSFARVAGRVDVCGDRCRCWSRLGPGVDTIDELSAFWRTGDGPCHLFHSYVSCGSRVRGCQFAARPSRGTSRSDGGAAQ